MTIQIEEIRAAALANETYSGTLNGQLAEFYRTGGGYPADVLRDLEPKWLELMGYTDPTLHDQWADYLANFGFTGELLANLQLEADARNLFPQWVPMGVEYLLMEDNSFLLMEDDSKLLLE